MQIIVPSIYPNPTEERNAVPAALANFYLKGTTVRYLESSWGYALSQYVTGKDYSLWTHLVSTKQKITLHFYNMSNNIMTGAGIDEQPAPFLKTQEANFMNPLKKIRVIAADDHEFLLDGIEAMIAGEAGIELVGKAKNGQQLIGLARELRPDVVITDLCMQDMSGIEAVKVLNTLEQAPASIILSMFDDDYYVIEAAKAGVLGYVTKGAPKTVLAVAIRAASQGQPYYCPVAGGKLARYFSRKTGGETAGPPLSFSEEEKAVIRMMAEGKESKEIAQTLFKSRAYINEARIRIRRKIGGNHLADIIRWAIRHGLIEG